jgi:hypothetical protein
MSSTQQTPPALNVIVASHERSGTHFLINTLALNFGFSPKWINSDITSGADFYLASHFRHFLAGLQHASKGRIVKEHHHSGFLEPLFDELREKFIVFYIYRNPADVMCSFWRYVRAAERREGPVVDSPAVFMRAAPSRGMLRYQMEQHATILDRWRAHVDAWTTLAVERAAAVAIGYEDLNLDFEGTVARIARRLEMACPNPVRPSVSKNVILPGPGRVGGFRELLSAEDVAFIREATEPTLRRLDLLRYLSIPAETPQRSAEFQ